MEILTLNPISKRIYEVLDENYHVSDSVANPDAILVRSFNMHEYEVGDNLLAVGRAGAGVNNIPLPEMTDRGVVVFNTPGANANAVKELVLCGLLLASRDVVGGIAWANSLQGQDGVPKLVEKGKKKFAGQEIFGKTLGVIGLGAIGGKVANSALALGMKVIGYDPVLSEKAKNALSPEVKVATLEEVLTGSDYITLHVPLLDSTRNMINETALAKMKDGAVVLNMSRAELADLTAVKAALQTGKLKNYVVDFPTEDALNVPGILAIPHLGASTEEAEDNCAVMAAAELKDYLENGNVVNSVNFPALSKVKVKPHRFTAVYNAGKGVEQAIADCCAKLNADISTAERGTVGYMIADTETSISDTDNGELLEKLQSLDDLINIRLL